MRELHRYYNERYNVMHMCTAQSFNIEEILLASDSTPLKTWSSDWNALFVINSVPTVLALSTTYLAILHAPCADKQICKYVQASELCKQTCMYTRARHRKRNWWYTLQKGLKARRPKLRFIMMSIPCFHVKQKTPRNLPATKERKSKYCFRHGNNQYANIQTNKQTNMYTGLEEY